MGMNCKVYSLALAAIIALSIMRGCPGEKRHVQSRSASGNIIVDQPQPDDQIESPVTVSGRARVFEAAASARVLSEDGRQLGIVHFMASRGAPDFGDFVTRVDYKLPAGVRNGLVEVFSNSAKDGRPINIVRIAVRFRTE
jgi:hypothetical protein